MNRNGLRSRWENLLACGLLAIGCIGTTGCQVDVAGMTLPSPWYLSDDLQYFPAGDEFKLANEAAAMKAYKAEATGEEGF